LSRFRTSLPNSGARGGKEEGEGKTRNKKRKEGARKKLNAQIVGLPAKDAQQQKRVREKRKIVKKRGEKEIRGGKNCETKWSHGGGREECLARS